MRYWTLFAPVLLAPLPGVAQAADCEPIFDHGDESVVVNGVEIAPGALATQNFQVRVRNAAASDDAAPGVANGSNPCSAIIRISRIGSPTPDFPAYFLRAPGQQQIEILPASDAGGTTRSDVVLANAPAGPSGRAVPFQIGVETEWGLRAGTYVEQLELSLVDSGGTITDRKKLTITITIPAAVSIRLVGAVIGGGGGGPASIDLGTLSSSAETRSQPFGARILSTSPYVVSLNSINSGKLAQDEGSAEILYRLTFDGALVDLSGANLFPYLSATPKSGDFRPMSLVVTPVSAPAGRYSDRITVTLSAL